MTEVTKEQLIYVADELNTLLFNPPEIPSGGDDEEIIQKIHEAVDILIPADTLSAELIDIITKTSLGTVVLFSKRTDMERDISIVELFSERTEFPLVMEEPEQEEEEEEEEEPEEEVPEEVPVPETAPEEEFGAVDLEDEQPDKLTKDVVDELEKNGHTTTPPIDYKELAIQLREQGVVFQREKTKWEKGKSPYSIALEIACTNPDMGLAELNAKFVDQTGLPLDKTTRPGINTAMSILRKVVGHLRENGHIVAKTSIKRATPRK